MTKSSLDLKPSQNEELNEPVREVVLKESVVHALGDKYATRLKMLLEKPSETRSPVELEELSVLQIAGKGKISVPDTKKMFRLQEIPSREDLLRQVDQCVHAVCGVADVEQNVREEVGVLFRNIIEKGGGVEQVESAVNHVMDHVLGLSSDLQGGLGEGIKNSIVDKIGRKPRTDKQEKRLYTFQVMAEHAFNEEEAKLFIKLQTKSNLLPKELEELERLKSRSRKDENFIDPLHEAIPA